MQSPDWEFEACSKERWWGVSAAHPDLDVYQSVHAGRMVVALKATNDNQQDSGFVVRRPQIWRSALDAAAAPLRDAVTALGLHLRRSR